MSNHVQFPNYFIGWDVGGWNCDKNGKSRDAVTILDSELAIVGKPWRGNLRQTINDANSSAEWIGRLFGLCDANGHAPDCPVVLAIDTPLGFPQAFVDLVTNLNGGGVIGQSETNHFLFRRTERDLFEHGLRPLSSIKDMIGSQATKGMHVLAKFASKRRQTGVWTDGKELTCIEAYPSPCKHSATVQKLLGAYSRLGHDDEQDALICALIGYLFTNRRAILHPPPADVPPAEGWIWLPTDALQMQRIMMPA